MLDSSRSSLTQSIQSFLFININPLVMSRLYSIDKLHVELFHYLAYKHLVSIPIASSMIISFKRLAAHLNANNNF